VKIDDEAVVTIVESIAAKVEWLEAKGVKCPRPVLLIDRETSAEISRAISWRRLREDAARLIELLGLPERPPEYRIRRIRYGNEGSWVPGEVVAACRRKETAERLAVRLGAREELGVVIECPDGTFDWGEIPVEEERCGCARCARQ